MELGSRGCRRGKKIEKRRREWREKETEIKDATGENKRA